MRYHSLETCCQIETELLQLWQKYLRKAFRSTNSNQVWLMWLQFLSSWQSQGGIFDRAKAFVQVRTRYRWRWFGSCINDRRIQEIDSDETLRLYSFFGVIKMYALKLWTGSMNSLILLSESHMDTKWWHSHIDTKWCNINFNNSGTFSGDVGSFCLF
jgi:hypothetical protein